jgi:hypothetical protein
VRPTFTFDKLALLIATTDVWGLQIRIVLNLSHPGLFLPTPPSSHCPERAPPRARVGGGELLPARRSSATATLCSWRLGLRAGRRRRALLQASSATRVAPAAADQVKSADQVDGDGGSSCHPASRGQGRQQGGGG